MRTPETQKQGRDGSGARRIGQNSCPPCQQKGEAFPDQRCPLGSVQRGNAGSVSGNREHGSACATVPVVDVVNETRIG